MKQALRLTLVTLFLVTGIAFSAQAQKDVAPIQEQPMTESQLQRMYQAFLNELGYENKIDSDGDVQFVRDGSTYFVEVNETDNEFFRVVLPNIWEIESVQENLQVVQACDVVNRQMKCTKAYTTNDNVWVAVELFIGKPENFKEVWERCLTAIDQGVQTFVDEM